MKKLEQSSEGKLLEPLFFCLLLQYIVLPLVRRKRFSFFHFHKVCRGGRVFSNSRVGAASIFSDGEFVLEGIISFYADFFLDFFFLQQNRSIPNFAKSRK